MNRPIRIASIAIAALTLSACVEDSSTREAPSSRGAGSNAESACMAAVNRNYGGNVTTVSVTGSEISQANSVVMVNAVGVRGGKQTERWRCLVSNDGNVQELSVVQ